MTFIYYLIYLELISHSSLPSISFSQILNILEDTIRVQLKQDFDWLPSFMALKGEDANKKIPLQVNNMHCNALFIRVMKEHCILREGNLLITFSIWFLAHSISLHFFLSPTFSFCPALSHSVCPLFLSSRYSVLTLVPVKYLSTSQ